MAFVIRSNRDMNLYPYENSRIGPGEYIDLDKNTNPITENIKNTSSTFSIYQQRHGNPIEIPFNTTSLRSEINGKIDNFPGPGAYNNENNTINKKNYTTFNNSKGLTYDNLKEKKVISIESNMLLNPNSENMGFLTSSKRFDYKKNNLDDQPGPGQYLNTFNSFSSLSTNTNKTGAKFFKTKNTFKKAGAIDRISSIPSKENFGYQILKNGKIILADDPDKNIRLSGLQYDSAGPGQYNLNSSWDANFVVWGKKKNKSSLSSRDNIIKELEKNSSDILTNYTEKMKSNNQSIMNSRSYENEKSKSKINKVNNDIKNENNNKNNIPRNVIFHNILERRKIEYQKSAEKVKNNLMTDLKYNDDPGPGFYEIDEKEKKKSQFKHNTNKQNFGSESPKGMSLINNYGNKLGPGEYFKEKNKFDTKTNNISNYRIKTQNNFNLNNVNADEVGVLLSKLRKKNYTPNLGPGEYNITSNFIKKEFTKMQKFGTSAERFKEEKKDPKEEEKLKKYKTPYNIIKENEKYYKKDKLIIGKNDKKDIEEQYLKEHKKIKISDEIPPVGSYNPGIVTSIAYRNSMKLNPHQAFIAPFNTVNNRLNTFNINNNDLGPGSYNAQKSFDMINSNKRSFKVFGEDEKFKRGIFSNKQNFPGPGNYDHEHNFDWNTKTFNVLFINKSS